MLLNSANLDYLAAVLTRPICFAHEGVNRLFMRLTPNEYGQSCSKANEIAIRFFSLFAIIPSAFIGLVSGLLGIVTRFVSNLIRKDPFTYVKGKAQEKISDKKFSLFSLNTCFIAGAFPLLKGGVMPWRERIDGIVKLIKEQKSDVVCLQEVHDIQACWRLYNALKDDYAHFYLNIGPNSKIGANSGLFVASKFKIEDPSFIAFDKKTLPGNGFVNKGFFNFTITSQGITLGQIYTTHLHHSEKDENPTKEEKECRKKQIEAIKQEMKKDGNKPKVLVGDLNMGQIEAVGLLSGDFKEDNQSPTSATDDLIEHVKTGSRVVKYFILDHTFLDKDCKTSLTTKVVDTFSQKIDEALSDHFGLLSNIG
jgi:endonuclease/exonuclease/phosphatase family metal-dependent hydrolase